MNTVEIREILGISRAAFSRRYKIPIRTLEEWDAGTRVPPQYVLLLLERVVREDAETARLEEIARGYDGGKKGGKKLRNPAGTTQNHAVRRRT